MNFTKTILEALKYYIDKIKVVADNAQITADKAIAVKADKKDIIQPIQSDWNQNDENQLDYIKNRTHYTTTEMRILFDEIVEDFRYSYTEDYDKVVEYYETTKIINYPLEFIDGEMYTVVWDGTTYTVKCNDRHLGDPSIWDNFKNYPFYIDYSYDNGLYFYTNDRSSTSHTIQISGAVEIPVQLNEKFIPDTIARIADIAQADWNQNDEAALDYIKNRTHYYEIIDSTILFDGDVRFESSAEDYAEIEYDALGLQNGQTYNVTVDSETIAIVCENARLSFNGTNKSIIFYNSWAKTYDSIGYCYLKIEKCSAILKQLDEKYIPDTIARVADIPDIPEAIPQIQADWNQNDNTQLDYVKNRPFYQSLSEIILFNETINDFECYEEGLAGDDDYIEYGYVEFWDVDEFPPFVEGKTYLVEWDGTTYESVFTDDRYLGAPSIYEFEEYPFRLYEGMDSVIIECEDVESTTHSIKISEINDTIRQLDEKFIPSTIARTKDITGKANISDIPTKVSELENDSKYAIVSNTVITPSTATVGQTIVVKSVDENGKPTEWECVDPFVLTDESSGVKYKLSVVSGKLTMTEVTA